MAGIRIEGNTSGNVVEVTGSNQLKVITETNAASNPNNVGGIRIFHENDGGSILGTPNLQSPEVDDDYRTRMALDHLLDTETFNYIAQNTGKHTYSTSTMTAVWGTNGLRTNGGAITTANTGMTVGTYAEFPIFAGQAIYAEFNASLDAAVTTNFVIDLGMFRRGAANLYAPTDGVYFRVNASGWQGVINYNGNEVSTSVFNFTHTNNQKYKFVITFNERLVQFWIDDILYGQLLTPAGNNQPCLSSTLPISIRHATAAGGASGAAISMHINNYVLHVGGYNYARSIGEAQNAALGSYQGLSGGTMGTLATYANSINPTAATPSNTALTTNLPAGLGGQGAANAAAAAVTDGIWGSYQVPAGTTAVQGKRLKIVGILVDAVNNGAAVATTATTIQFSLGFGNTAVSLATGEATAAKASRRLALGYMTWPVGAGIGAGPQSGPIKVNFSNAPIYVNSGEFVQLVAKFLVGTATPSQVINFVWQPIYSWE